MFQLLEGRKIERHLHLGVLKIPTGKRKMVPDSRRRRHAPWNSRRWKKNICRLGYARANGFLSICFFRFVPSRSLTVSFPLKSYRNPIGKENVFQPPFLRGELLNFGGVFDNASYVIKSDHQDFHSCTSGSQEKETPSLLNDIIGEGSSQLPISVLDGLQIDAYHIQRYIHFRPPLSLRLPLVAGFAMNFSPKGGFRWGQFHLQKKWQNKFWFAQPFFD